MKDILIPVMLLITTIITGVFFVTKIYQPQRETLDVIAENSQNSSFAVTYVSDGQDEIVSGTVVKSTIDYYSMDNSKEVCVQKGPRTVMFTSNKYGEGPNIGSGIVIDNHEKYIRQVKRDSNTKEVIRVSFINQ